MKLLVTGGVLFFLQAAATLAFGIEFKNLGVRLPPVAIGSHLDTQPEGGRFDGVYGVLAALEVVRALNDAGVETERPIEIVSWTNEEGARFTPAMLGSAVLY